MSVEKASSVHTTIIDTVTSEAVLADDSLTADKIAAGAITADTIGLPREEAFS